MLQETWYHGTIRKYVIAFGTLFNDIYINRVDGTGKNVQTMKIPLTYGPKDKSLARIFQDPDLKRPIAINLPIMSFEILSMDYDPVRKLNSMNQLIKGNPTRPSDPIYQYMPVPYNITFELDIYVKNAEDGTRILEQILPYFTPEYNVTVDLNPEFGLPIDVPVILQSTMLSDLYEGGMTERRILQWILTFNMKGYIFGRTNKPGDKCGGNGLGGGKKFITKATTNFYPSLTGNTNAESLIITPGLTANGEPTTNPNETIPRDQIKPDDNWDFIMEFSGGE